MNGRVYLCLHHHLYQSNPEYRVSIEREEPTDSESGGGLSLCFQSPLFAVADDAYIPEKEQPYDITFVVHQQPFIQIGKLDREARKFLWYSMGVTAIVLITPSEGSHSQILDKLDKADVLCQERWSIRDGKLSPEPRVDFNVRGESVNIRLPNDAPQDPDLRRVIRELHLNLVSLVKRARVLDPLLLPTVERIISAAHREIETLALAERAIQKSVAPVTPTPNAETDPTQLFLASHKQSNLSLDALVQLNSALAYILSQTFFGAPPLQLEAALNSCHSLLGLGTAISAIQRLAEFIVEGFAEHPISTIVEQHYANVTVATQLCRDDAAPTGRTVDHYNVGRREQTPKLAYFSTRMGFSEHAYCVTAATQCLASADSARRSPLTLSHELLHAHVRGLFGTILAATSDSGTEDNSLLTLVREYKALGKQPPATWRNWTLRQFLLFRIFAFCDGMNQVVAQFPACRVDGDPAKNLGAEPDRDDHSEVMRFTNAFEFLNEIVVHVLDLHYFYDCSERIYLATLWRSWATIPGVADRIEWYMLRSIIAVSVVNMNSLCSESFCDLKDLTFTYDEGPGERFNGAMRNLTSVLEELCEANPSAAILRVVLGKAKDVGVREWLKRAFFPSHLFAQCVKQFLYSPKLRNYFGSYRDVLADRDDSGEPIYKLDSLEFGTGPIQNPIALLLNRLRREFDGPEPEDEERRSAWLFLALASVPVKTKPYPGHDAE